MVKISIDPFAGFCPGVKKTISLAGEILASNDYAYSLGELVHCPEELNRLSEQGLTVIGSEEVGKFSNSVILIRAHGVTPEIQHELEKSDNIIVDSTCSIVRRLQQKVRSVSQQMLQSNGQIVIFGKKKHPEVEGLVGYSNCKVIVIEKPDEFSKIEISRPISVFAQTTANVVDFESFITNLSDKLSEVGVNRENLQVYNTICGSIKMRVPKLREFARENDVIVFVSGEQSSNGTYLSSIALKENINTHKISSETELMPQWFENAKKIGITGAASTPEWLLNRVAESVRKQC
ncbi:MAG: 4-hydroxy-3-methylbut-2-enyl diphosphate reductase [Chloroflexota bacterium]